MCIVQRIPEKLTVKSHSIETPWLFPLEGWGLLVIGIPLSHSPAKDSLWQNAASQCTSREQVASWEQGQKHRRARGAAAPDQIFPS